MPHTPLRVFRDSNAIGEYLADRVLQRFETARAAGRPFLLGCPTGRTPRPFFGALARRLAETRSDISHVVLVMMDEYLVEGAAGLAYAPASEPWSCHHFVQQEIADRLNAVLPAPHRLREGSIWFPRPDDPDDYESVIVDAGGIDLFLLASGARDGHVAFNPPGSPLDSRTRIIELSDETRRDNLETFPAFGALSAVPRHGVSVGVGTIVDSKEAVMVAWGTGKQTTLSRMLGADRYEPDWPATLIHECAVREIVSDVEAAGDVAS